MISQEQFEKRQSSLERHEIFINEESSEEAPDEH
jgi:hypothetical protein